MVGVLEKPRIKKPETQPQKKEAEFSKQKPIGEILAQLDAVFKRIGMDIQERLIDRAYYKRQDPNLDDLQDLESFIRNFLESVGYYGFFRKSLQLDQERQKEIIDRLTVESRFNPRLFKTYVEVLAKVKRENEEKIKNTLEHGKKFLRINPELRSELDDISIKLEENSDLPKAQIELIKKEFPSGNFLLHKTDVEKSLMILKSGRILTAEELEKNSRKRWSRGGHIGIAFNFNNVRVLTGDPGHFMGFLTAPETVLTDDNKLGVYTGGGNLPAKYEVQLLPKKSNSNFPEVPVSQTMVLVNDKDAATLKDIMAGVGVKPKAILIYPRNQLRAESWRDPIGDHEILDGLIAALMDKAGLSPSIKWADFFGREPVIQHDTFTETPAVKEIIKKGKGLELTEKTGDTDVPGKEDQELAALKEILELLKNNI